MTEELSPEQLEPEEIPTAPASIERSKGLTIPARRLAGSAHCLNCGTGLNGPFCYYCGQPDKNFTRFFPVMVRDLITDFLDLDSRFFRTLKPLLSQPGKLTRDYLNGQRFRYTPPLRLYIFSSMAFFILAAMLAGGAISIGSDDTQTVEGIDIIKSPDSTAEELEQAREELNQVKPGLGDKVTTAMAEASEAQAVEEAETSDETARADSEPSFKASNTLEIDDDQITLNGEPWDPVTNPYIIKWVPDWVNDWINVEIGESPQKGKEIEENPNLIIDKVFDVLPATMFILLPLSALILKFWYLFSGRYYIEHLILALHNHSFLFVIFLCTMLLNSLAGWRDPDETGAITEVVFWINLALYIWIPVYFLLSLKRVYEQGWTLTVGKYLVVGLSYFFLLMTAASVAALLSFVMI